MPVSFKELCDAYEFANFGENEAFVHLQSGKIYIHSPDLDLDDEDALPDDVYDDEKYARIPDKRELDLGKPLVLDFASEIMPDDFERVQRIFSRRGAYATFRDLLHERGTIDKWYEYEQKATEAALREWCEAYSIELVD